MDHLGSSIGIVSGFYIGVLLPWAILYFHDYISETLKTVRRTFVLGIFHCVFASVPILYVVPYIAFQARLKEPDYKEMYAAIVAVVLSLYHLYRSWKGLKDLCALLNWSSHILQNFKSGGYLQSEYYQQEEALKHGPHSNYIISDTNRLQAGGMFGLLKLFRTLKQKFLNFVETTMRCVYGFREEESVELSGMLINSSLIDNEVFSKRTPGKLTDRLVIWSLFFLSQFGEQWIEDARENKYHLDTWDGKRWDLASKVWATAVLRMEIQGNDEFPNRGSKSLLDPCWWSSNTRELNDQVFDKRELLKKIYEKGTIPPFNEPLIKEHRHVTAKSRTSSLNSRLIRNGVAMLPPALMNNVSELNVDQLEWFVIFSTIDQWKTEMRQPIPKLPPSSHSSFSSSSSSYNFRNEPSVIQKRGERLRTRDTPVVVLQRQLGLDKPPDTGNCAFPFPRMQQWEVVKKELRPCGYGKLLWDNKCVLQVSARIDNWISLRTGEQLKFLYNTHSVEKEEFLQEISSTRCPISKDYEMAYSQNNEDQKYEGVVEHHRKLEYMRLRYQLANHNSKYFSHLEQGLSFVGCIMESLRSGLAESLNARKKSDTQGTAWNVETSDDKIGIEISEQLHDCIFNRDKKFDSSIQERILWECQNSIHKFQGTRNSQFGFNSLTSVMLCILAFPGICVSIDSEKKYPQHQRELVIKISPVFPPENFAIEVVFKKNEEKAYLALSESKYFLEQSIAGSSSHKRIFSWQLWRDAFEGRLLGKLQWNGEHFMRGISVCKTIKSISAGIGELIESRQTKRGKAWDGWRPFRSEIYLFELKYSQMILDSDLPSTSADVLTSDSASRESIDNKNKYEVAEQEVILDARNSLKQILFGKNTESDRRIDEREFKLVRSVPSEYKMSTENEENILKTQREAIEELNAEKMTKLASWVLDGENGYQRNREEALLLLERALSVGKRLDTARLLVYTLLDFDASSTTPSTSVREMNIQRACDNIESLWRDLKSRHTLRDGPGGPKSTWKFENNRTKREEEQNFFDLRELNYKLVQIARDSKSMRRFGKWLWMFDLDTTMATEVFESAIVASCDIYSITKLILIHQSNKRPKLAKKLSERAKQLLEDDNFEKGSIERESIVHLLMDLREMEKKGVRNAGEILQILEEEHVERRREKEEV